MENKQYHDSWASYTRGTHRIGRICTLITLCMLVGAPFLMGTYQHAKGDRKSTRLNSSHITRSRMPSSA